MNKPPWDTPGVIQTLGELIIKGVSQRQIAVQLSLRYAPTAFSAGGVASKIYSPTTRKELATLFSKEEMDLINGRFAVDKHGQTTLPATKPNGEEPYPSVPSFQSYLAHATGPLDDCMGPLKPPAFCQNCKVGARERGYYCLICAASLYEPRKPEKDRALTRMVLALA